MKKEDFTLRKIKLSGGAVEVDYTQTITHGAVIQEVETSERRLRSPHPDLTKSLQLLGTFVARATHLDALDIARGFGENGGKATKEVKLLLEQMQQRQSEILDSIDVRGVSIKGQDDKMTIVITSVVSCKNQSFTLNTPRIVLGRNIYGCEVAIAESIDELSDEVYQYLFAGKEAQMQMEFDEPKETD